MLLERAIRDLAVLMERVDRKLDRFVITKRGRPVAVLLGADDYESLMETLDILADPKALAGLRKGEADIRKGRTRSWIDIKKSLAKL
jgi:prevent-host-death family protein